MGPLERSVESCFCNTIQARVSNLILDMQFHELTPQGPEHYLWSGREMLQSRAPS
jgi:hypothetical protein